MLISFLKKEWLHYKTLPNRARLLILSYNLRSVAYPILSLFLNAYIWRTTTSIISVVAYSLGHFIFLPIGFYLNGKLLKRLHINQTHFLGLFCSLLGMASVIFFHSSLWYHLFVFGIIYGFGNGIYWASRNYLTFQETTTNGRNYFFAILSFTDSIISIVVSFSIGWLISFGDISKLYSPLVAYTGITILALISILFGGLNLLRAKFETPTVNQIWQPVISKRWNSVRMVNVVIGILETIVPLISTLLILRFLGKEGILGTITATVGIFTIILYYLYGRLAKQNHRSTVLVVALTTSFLLAYFLIVGQGILPIFIYVLLAGLPITFYMLAYDPWQLDIMDKELSNNPQEKYALIFDCEVFLNIGRVISLLIFLTLILKFSGDFALKTTPLILSVLQIIFFALIWKRLDWEK
ncbi:MAG: MFS transporter [Candidatus Magasanikiibacteriota bacterium]